MAGRGLLRDASMLGAGLVTAQLITVLTYWLTARSLGPADFGLLLGAVGLARMMIAEKWAEPVDQPGVGHAAPDPDTLTDSTN